MPAQYVNLAKGARGWPQSRTKLDGRTFKLVAIYNANEQFWSLNILDSSGVMLRAGLVLRHAVNVLAPFRDPTLPPGQLGAWDTSGKQADPGRDSLARSSDVRLVYIPAADAGA